MEINEDILIRYINGMLTEEEAAEVKNWRAASLENEKLLEQVYFTAQVASRLKVMRTVNPDEALSRFKSRIHKKEKRLALRQVLGVIQRATAVLFIPVFLLSAYLFIQQGQGNVRTLAVRTNPGVVSAFDLPDGSKVWLNAGSSLKYPTQFNDKQRVVSMQGEAYFEVESDKEHPFIVKTKQLTVEATGTAFNVNAYAPDHVAAVTLVKGKVAVTLDQKKTIPLSPGEKIDYNLATSLYNVNKTNTYKWCSWKDGILIFRDDPLEYVFKRLGQTYNVEFILKDAELGKYSYKATFEGESLNEILRLLEMSAPIRCKEVSNRNSNNEKFEKQRIEVSRIVGK